MSEELVKLDVSRESFDARAREAGWQERTLELLHRGGELRSRVKVGEALLRIVRVDGSRG